MSKIIPDHVERPLFFDSLMEGESWGSARRTITEADVALFAGLSGDFNPLHADHDSAAAGPFGRPIAHGLLGIAVASGLASHAPPMATIAFLRIVEWRFVAPIFFGDTIEVISEVAKLEPHPRGRRGTVTWKRTLINQRGEVVQEGLLQTVVNCRAAVTEAGDDE